MHVLRIMVGAGAAWTGTAFAQPVITDLRTLPSFGVSATATGVNADGSVVVGYCYNGAGQWRAFRWSASGGMADLGTLPTNPTLPPSDFSMARGVNGNGSVVVGSSSSFAGERAFRWTSGGMQNLGTLPGGFSSMALGVSGDGQVVVGFALVGSDLMAFRRTSTGAMQNLGTFPGGLFYDGSVAYGANYDGSVVVGVSSGATFNYHAFRWTSAGLQDLGTLPGGGDASWARAVSANGSVVVGKCTLAGGHERAFRWTTDGMVDLGTLPGALNSEALGLSADGSLVIGNTGGGGDRAFLWTPATGMVELNTYLPTLGVNLSGWSLGYCTGVSADGTAICGWGSLNGATRAWVVDGLPATCYPDCNTDGALTIADFGCFQTKFVAADPYADCNSDGQRTVADFGCFQSKFAAGCP